jgi:hypothetical protein
MKVLLKVASGILIACSLLINFIFGLIYINATESKTYCIDEKHCINYDRFFGSATIQPVGPFGGAKIYINNNEYVTLYWENGNKLILKPEYNHNNIIIYTDTYNNITVLRESAIISNYVNLDSANAFVFDFDITKVRMIANGVDITRIGYSN